jgi:hypothetical protein
MACLLPTPDARPSPPCGFTRTSNRHAATILRSARLCGGTCPSDRFRFGPVSCRTLSRFDSFYPRREHAPHVSRFRSGRADGLIIIGPMLPKQHPIKSAKLSIVRPCFVVRPVVSTNARCGYTPLMLLRRRLRGSWFGEALFPRKPHPGSMGGPLQGRYLERKLVCPLR